MFSNFKKRLGVLTAIAVMAALVPALAASPASAAVSLTAVAPNNGALHSACPTGSASAAGFTDTTSTDVDCIKMHGITTGVTATTYEPASNIPRYQMALYLTRFATAAGVTLGSGADQGFTDISGYTAAIQTAINQLKQLGVTTGTTTTTYSPGDNVTREQMAMFVERLLGKTTAGVGGSGVTATYSGKISTATLTYNYTDIDAGAVTYEGHNAIAEIYHLGIPGHAKTVTTFSPADAITRADMATWMTNALAHTNARPAGVWTQVTGANANTGFGDQVMTLHISHRDANRAAVPGTLIDVFADVTAANTDPFAATGLCNATTNTIELGNTGGDECKVDLGDVSTDAFGNIGGSAGTTGGTVTAATTTTYWAYTAATGTAFNNLTMTANTVARSQATAAAVLKLTNTIPANNSVDSTDVAFEMVKYGTSVTITGTARTSATGTVVAGAFGVKVVDTVITVNDDGVAGNLANSDGTDVTTSVTTTTGATAAGVWSHTVTQADPTPVGTALSATTSRTHTTSVVTADLDGNGTYEYAAGTVSLAWDDNAAGAKSATLTEGSYWGLGVATAAGGVSRTATATVFDQYGTGVPNLAVVFTNACASGSTDCDDSFTDSSSRTTNSVGVATLSYTDVNVKTGKQTTTATPTGVTAATSIYYRIDALTANHTETDATNADGAIIGTNFTATTGDVWTFAANHGLSDGDAVIITVIADNLVCAVACAAGETEYFIKKETGSTVAVKLYTTRSVSALGVVTYSGLKNVTTAGTGTSGRIELGDADGGVVAAGDEYMEIMVNDAANDRLIVERQSTAADFDYHAFTYDSGDQFNIYADGTGANSLTPASMATFEIHVAAKMNALTGAPGAGFNGDIHGITYTNAAAGGGVSVFNLGS